jgi:uncharacterized protein
MNALKDLIINLKSDSDYEKFLKIIDKHIYYSAEFLSWLFNTDTANCQLCLGTMYSNGYGVLKDTDQAIKYLELSSAQNNAYAQAELAEIHVEKKDYATAYKYAKLSADNGNSYGEYILGVCHDNGHGTTKNTKEALRLYQLSVDKGNKHAQNNLGVMYLDIDKKKATELFKLSAAQDHHMAMANLGYCYMFAQGITRNYTEAMRLNKLSLGRSKGYAENNMGFIYNDGKGVPRSRNMAFKYFQLSALQYKNKHGQYNLGVMYRSYYCPVKRDKMKALQFFKLSADQDYEPALKEYNKLLFDRMQNDGKFLETIKGQYEEYLKKLINKP